MTRRTAGVDVGSSWSKAMVVDEDGQPCGWAVVPTGLELAAAGSSVLEQACAHAGCEPADIGAIASTGYGRGDVKGSGKIRSEIMCLAKGAYALCPEAMTLVDIGGQDSKVIFLDEEGHRTDYRMNRRCAAGTGAFLETVCLRLGLPLDQLNLLAQDAEAVAPISSFCSVFAATEVIDLLRKGYRREAIARGVYRSVAQRVADMGLRGPALALAGGVAAHHPMLAQELGELTGFAVRILPHPQHVGALGAALLAREDL